MVYINDVLIFSMSIKHHLEKIVRIVKEHGLVVSASKMKLFQTKEIFLGQYIYHGSITYYLVILLRGYVVV